MEGREGWVVIGIGGVTCGGKTSLANQLKTALSPVYVFHQDEYFYPDDSPHHVLCDGIAHNNYDILTALDMPALYDDILATIKGVNRAHSTNLDGRNTLMLEGKKFLIVEGFTALNYGPILELCDYRYYMVLSYGECFARRSLRVYSPPDVPGYFEQCVWPEHTRYRAQMEADGRVRILDGAAGDAFHTVMAELRTLLPAHT